MKDYKPETKRSKKRIASKLDVMCRQISGGNKTEFWCLSTDVSELGIRILSERVLDPEKSVFLQINIPYPRNAVITAMGRIRWRRDHKDEKRGIFTHLYGIGFDEIDPRSRETLFRYLFPRGDAEEAGV